LVAHRAFVERDISAVADPADDGDLGGRRHVALGIGDSVSRHPARDDVRGPGADIRGAGGLAGLEVARGFATVVWALPNGGRDRRISGGAFEHRPDAVGLDLHGFDYGHCLVGVWRFVL